MYFAFALCGKTMSRYYYGNYMLQLHGHYAYLDYLVHMTAYKSKLVIEYRPLLFKCTYATL